MSPGPTLGAKITHQQSLICFCPFIISHFHSLFISIYFHIHKHSSIHQTHCYQSDYIKTTSCSGMCVPGLHSGCLDIWVFNSVYKNCNKNPLSKPLVLCRVAGKPIRRQGNTLNAQSPSPFMNNWPILHGENIQTLHWEFRAQLGLKPETFLLWGHYPLSHRSTL